MKFFSKKFSLESSKPEFKGVFKAPHCSMGMNEYILQKFPLMDTVSHYDFRLSEDNDLREGVDYVKLTVSIKDSVIGEVYAFNKESLSKKYIKKSDYDSKRGAYYFCKPQFHFDNGVWYSKEEVNKVNAEIQKPHTPFVVRGETKPYHYYINGRLYTCESPNYFKLISSIIGIESWMLTKYNFKQSNNKGNGTTPNQKKQD